MLILLCSSSAVSSLNPLQGGCPSLTRAPCWKGLGHPLFFPNVWAENPGMQAAGSYSSLQPDQDTDKGLRQTHSLDIVRDKFMRISISPALRMGTGREPHYQQAGENFPHRVPGAMLMQDKIHRWTFFSCSMHNLFNINTLGLLLVTCSSPFVSHFITYADNAEIYLLFSSD